METSIRPGGLLSQNRPVARRQRGKAKPAQKRTGLELADGFLAHRFAPLCSDDVFQNAAARERDFQESLSWLCAHYGLSCPVCTDPYPANVDYYLKWIKKKLGPGHAVHIREDERAATIIVEHEMIMNLSLYYIPLKPVFECRNRPQYPVYNLLLSCLAYLHEVVGINWYTNEGYLAYQYDAMKDYYFSEIASYADNSEGDEELIQEREELEYNMHLTEEALIYGNLLYKRLKRGDHLRHFKRRLERFTPQDDAEQKLLEAATKLYALWRQYPTRSANDSIQNQLAIEGEEEEDYYERDVMRLDYWLSFVWDNDEVLSQIEQNLNECEYANCSGVEEPRSVIVFDRADAQASHDLSFDEQFYPVLHEFSEALYPLFV